MTSSPSTASGASPPTRRSSRRRWRSGTDYDDQLRELVGGGSGVEAAVLGARRAGHRRCGRHPAAALRLLGRGRRVRLHRGRPRPRPRHRPNARAGAGSVRAARPSERDDQDPGDARGSAGDQRRDRGRVERQHHADLRPRAVPRSDRGLPRRSRTTRRARRGRLGDRVGRVVLREPRRHRNRSPPPRRPRPAGKGCGGEREACVRGVPRTVLGAAVGRPVGRGRAAATAAVGVDVDEEPRLLPDACTSTSSSAATP